MHVQRTRMMVPEWTSVREDSGTHHRMHSLMYGSSNRSTTTSSAYRRHEQAKKREYGQRIREVEHGVFTPLVFSSTGGMGREAATFYKRLANMISQKQQHPYPSMMGWLRCRLSFASLRSAIMCIRGSRSSFHRPVHGVAMDITLATSEGRVPT